MSPPAVWLARLLTYGQARGPWRFDREIGPELARRAINVPVRFAVIDGIRAHPPDDANPFDPATLVGSIAASWADDSGVYAQLHLVDETPLAVGLRRGLFHMEHDGVLPRLAPLSLVARLRARPVGLGGREVLQVTAIVSVIALDFVYCAGADGACLLRSLPAQDPLTLERSPA